MTKGTGVELFIFARFHARLGQERAVEEALAAVVPPSRAEAGCLDIHAYRSIRDPRVFYVHSRWIDEAAFDAHATLPHTVAFVERMTPLIDHPFDVTRSERLV
jgi:quinol monooxygenase YgiN